MCVCVCLPIYTICYLCLYLYLPTNERLLPLSSYQDPRVLRGHGPQPQGGVQGRGGRVDDRRLRQGRELEAGGRVVHLGQRAADRERPGPEGLRGARRQRERQRDAADVVLLHPPRQGLHRDLGAPEHHQGHPQLLDWNDEL